ncbi:hypothetical protein Ancab_036699 [Ancistrocladus abbreviatus]
MGGKQPKVILTYQESAIGGAIDKVMPGTLHRAINIDSKAVANNEAYEVALNGLDRTLKEVELILKNLPLSFAVEIDETVQQDGNSNLLRPLGDPTKMRHKGRTKRLKSFLDNPKKRRVGKTGRKSGQINCSQDENLLHSNIIPVQVLEFE